MSEYRVCSNSQPSCLGICRREEIDWQQCIHCGWNGVSESSTVGMIAYLDE